MRRLEWSTIVIVILWIVVGLWMLIYSKRVGAQDNAVMSCYTRTDAGAVFTFSNIPDSWLGGLGWYYIGDDVKLEGRTLIVTGLQFDNGYAYAIVGSGDYQENATATTEITSRCAVPIVPSTTPQPPIIPTPEPAITQIPISTGRTCTIQYPKIILVCNG